MYNTKIKNLEKKLKKLYYAPPKDGINSDPERQEFMKNFWDYHVSVVVENSDRMAKKEKADKDIVHVGALMHDLGFFYSRKNHDLAGAPVIYKMLVEEKFDKKFARAVSNIALCHRCRRIKPKTLEEKIVVTADAIAHFSPAYYLGLSVIANEDYRGLTKNNLKKLIKDFNDKIFFESEKKKFKRVVKAFKKIFRKK